MQKDCCCNSLVLSWQQASWNRWETFEQCRDLSRGINRAVPLKQGGALLVTWFIIRPYKIIRLEGTRYDKILQEKEEGASNSWSKNIWCIWQHVWLCLALCAIFCCMTQERHKGFADSSVPFLHSSSLYGFIFFFIHLKIWLLLYLWAAERTMLSFSQNKSPAPQLLDPVFSDRREQMLKVGAEQAESHTVVKGHD